MPPTLPDLGTTPNTALLAILYVVLWWLMQRLEKRLDVLAEKMPPETERAKVVTDVMGRLEKIDARLDRVARAMEVAARAELLRMLSAPDTPPRVRDQAETVLRELDGRD